MICKTTLSVIFMNTGVTLLIPDPTGAVIPSKHDIVQYVIPTPGELGKIIKGMVDMVHRVYCQVGDEMRCDIVVYVSTFESEL